MAGALSGLRLLSTRPVDPADALVTALEDAGATVLRAPMIRFQPTQNPAALAAALAAARTLILTSPRAVAAVASRVGPGVPCFVLGARTREDALAAGLHVVDVGDAPHGAALGEAMVRHGGLVAPVVMPTSDVARPAVAEVLAGHGVPVDVVEAYQTVAERSLPPLALEALQRGTLHAVLCMSPSAVDALVELVEPGWLAPLCRVAPGNTTAAAWARHGLPAAVVARSPEVDGVVDALVSWWRPA